MTELNPQQELLITRFSDQLSVVVGPDDMFPPEDGVREPAKPLPPIHPLMAAAELSCRVFCLDQAREHRNRLAGRTAMVLEHIDSLVTT